MEKKAIEEKAVEEKAVQEEPVKIKQVKVTAKAGLNVRAKASKKSDVVRVLNNGDVVDYESKARGFYKIADGYIMAEFVEVL